MEEVNLMAKCLLTFWIAASGLLQVDCKYVLEFQFHNYLNANGRLATGHCCDSGPPPERACDRSCDTKFTKLCLRNSGSETCISGTKSNPGFVGENNINFTNTIGTLSNPFNYSGENAIPEDGFDLYLKIKDDDVDDDDLIDEVIFAVSSTLKRVASTTVAGEHGRVSLTLSYTLQCESNYYGSNCTKYCIPQDDNNGHYTCDNKTGEIVCRDGWQNPDSNCVEVACSVFCSKDGGTCDDHGDCVCNDGWSGDNCSTPICAEDCSGTGGYCNSPGECTCYPTWTGDNCDTKLCDKCSNETGHCHNGTCICNIGYTGSSCETDLDPCSHHTCANDGTCDSYNCSCPAGVTCEIYIDECLDNSTWMNSTRNYSCLCDDGWAGDHCETDIDDCEDNPCLHGGNCTDLLNGHDCSCTAEYEGLNCELLVDACSPNPCENNSTCTNLVTDYTCRCSPPYMGRNCELLVDACFPNPCENNSTCTNLITNYTCQCSPLYKGRNCEWLITSIRADTDSNTDSAEPTPTVIALIATGVLVAFLMLIVMLLLGVLCWRSRATRVSDRPESLTVYDSKGSKKHNPTVKPKPHHIYDHPLYSSTSIDPTLSIASSTTSNTTMQFSMSDEAPVHRNGVGNDVPNVTSNYAYAEPILSSSTCPIYESCETSSDDSILNPLYHDTLSHTVSTRSPASIMANNLMISGRSVPNTYDDYSIIRGRTDTIRNMVNPAYEKPFRGARQEGENDKASLQYDYVDAPRHAPSLQVPHKNQKETTPEYY